jgi:hypothetical protein
MSVNIKGVKKQYVGEADEVVVGKFYYVLHGVDSGGVGVPIIGKLHADPQFGVSYKHYHVDARFLNAGQYGVIGGKTNRIVFDSDIVKYEVRLKKCRNKNTGINPPPKNGPFKHIGYHNWVESMVGKSCKGKKCPHFGTAMAEINGRLVCPLHNLVGNMQTELITGADF